MTPDIKSTQIATSLAIELTVSLDNAKEPDVVDFVSYEELLNIIL